MRLIHTSDWHVGKVFPFAGESVMSLLQQARLEAIGSIGELAMAENAPTVLVAGDIYDKPSPETKTLAQPLEVMRRFPKVAWHLIPGNHDPDLPNGLWQRLPSVGLPDNVHLHRDAVPVSIGVQAWLLPAPLQQRHHLTDPTSWMDSAPTPDGQLRIGLAHGSIADFGSESATPNVIAPDRARKAGLAYMALGDWHGMKRIGRATWYSGTPEPDRFGPTEVGQVLLVDFDTGDPHVTSHETGRYRWVKERAVLQNRDDILRLEQRFRSSYPDLSNLLLRLDVEGMLTLAEHDVFDQSIAETGLAAALCFLDLDSEHLIIRPSKEELEQLTTDRVVKEAIRRLRMIAETEEHPDRQAANRAIRHLHFACHRRQQEAAA